MPNFDRIREQAEEQERARAPYNVKKLRANGSSSMGRFASKNDALAAAQKAIDAQRAAGGRHDYFTGVEVEFLKKGGKSEVLETIMLEDTGVGASAKAAR